MATMSILRHALALNAKEITAMQASVAQFKVEAKAWREQGEQAYAVAASKDVEKHRASLSKLVTMQRKIKAEIHAIERNERITRKYAIVFGKAPILQSKTSYEMESMLDTLLAEKQAEAEVEAVA
jgi:hypothetical protein